MRSRLNNFPAIWPQQTGSPFSTGSGSVTVLGPPVTVTAVPSGGNIQLSWSDGILLEATNVLGPWTTNNNTSPYTVTTSDPEHYYRIQVH